VWEGGAHRDVRRAVAPQLRESCAPFTFLCGDFPLIPASGLRVYP